MDRDWPKSGKLAASWRNPDHNHDHMAFWLSVSFTRCRCQVRQSHLIVDAAMLFALVVGERLGPNGHTICDMQVERDGRHYVV